MVVGMWWALEVVVVVDIRSTVLVGMWWALEVMVVSIRSGGECGGNKKWWWWWLIWWAFIRSIVGGM